MTKSRGWLSVAKDVPAAMIEAVTGEEPYVFEPGDQDSTVVKIPTDLNQMHKLAEKLINDGVHFDAEADRARRASEKAARDLARVHDAIDKEMQKINTRLCRQCRGISNE